MFACRMRSEHEARTSQGPAATPAAGGGDDVAFKPEVGAGFCAAEMRRSGGCDARVQECLRACLRARPRHGLVFTSASAGMLHHLLRAPLTYVEAA